MVPLVRRALQRIDGVQRRVALLGVGYAVVRKFADDDANLLAVALAWYGFTAIYPLLLIVVTVLGYIGVSSLGDTLVHTLHQFPVIGTDFNPGSGGSNLHGSPVAAAVGIVGLLYGAQGVTQTAEHAMARVWNVPRTELPGFLPRLLRSLAGLAVIALAFFVNAMVGGLATVQSNVTVRLLLIVGLGLLNVALFFVGFWALTPTVERQRDLVPGPSSPVSRSRSSLRSAQASSSTSCGTPATPTVPSPRSSVSSRISFCSPPSRLYAAELNPVLARRLWPRAIAGSPTPADAELPHDRAVGSAASRRCFVLDRCAFAAYDASGDRRATEAASARRDGCRVGSGRCSPLPRDSNIRSYRTARLRKQRNAPSIRAVRSRMTKPRRILLVSGSLRRMSTNAAVLRTAASLAPEGVVAELYDGMRALPHFDPDDDREPLDRAVAALRAAIRGVDALLFSTPEYAGALPGSFKNLLDWTIGDDRAGSIYEKPVAWINASPRGARQAHDSLRLVLGYAHATIVEAACAEVAVHNADIGADGLVHGSTARRRIESAVARLAEAARYPAAAG